MSELSYNFLLEVLEYDQGTGIFVWKKSRGRVKKGAIAGSLHKSGYLVVTLNRKHYLAHRLAWFYTHTVWPKDQIDHINHVRNDNSLVNLQESSDIENRRNGSLSKNNTSGVNGVVWNKGCNKWQAQIMVLDFFLLL